MFQPPRPVHPARIANLLATRAAAVPQLTRSLRGTWWPPAGAAWTEDTNFAAEHHVHTHRPPRLGMSKQLGPTVAAITAEPLPPGRPPWQLHVISGTGHGQFAVLVKLHHALADGAGVLAVAGALLDKFATPTPRPKTEPVAESKRFRWPVLGWPSRALRATTDLAGEVVTRVQQNGQVMGIAAATLTAIRPASIVSPVTSVLDSSLRRQSAVVRLDVDDLHRARTNIGGTLNDAVLSVIAGGLRSWLAHNGDAAAVTGGGAIRAFIPVSMRGSRRGMRDGGNQLSGFLCDLPVGEPDPVARAHAVQAAMRRNKAAGPTRGAGAFPLVADALPAVVHRVATPLLGNSSQPTPAEPMPIQPVLPSPAAPLRANPITATESIR